jgi:hypothetical protein
MSNDLTEQHYPPGIPERRPLPRTPDAAVGSAAAGAIAAIAVGGLIGALVYALSRTSLKEAVEQALQDKGAALLNFYRRGPYSAEVLFEYQGQFWTISSQAPFHDEWTQAALNDWLYGDLVDVQLPRKLVEIQLVSHG